MVRSSSTTGLTVNAAFLKEIKDDNRQLCRLFAAVESLIVHPQMAGNHWATLTKHVASLADQLALHLTLEEAYGYFDEAIDADPNVSLEAETLRAEHPKLFESLRRLAEEMPEIAGSDEESLVGDDGNDERVACWINRYRLFRSDFDRHEEAEVRLIVEAMDRKLGSVSL